VTSTGLPQGTSRAPASVRSGTVEVTPALFAIPFGFAGLSGAWNLSGAPCAAIVAIVLAAISAVLVVALAMPWVARLVRHESSLAAELRDPVLGASLPALPISAMLVSARLLVAADTLGRTLVAIFAILTLVTGVAIVVAWLVPRLPLGAYQPGFYLPTAGGSLLAAQCLTGLGWTGFAQVLFFVGLASWLILAVVTSLRLARTPLTPALRPVMAIQLAAPALAGNTYLVVFHRFDGYAITLAAITVVMGLVEVALIPYYRRAQFGPAFWVTSFSYATTDTLALRWIIHGRPVGTDAWRAVTLAPVTGMIVLLAVATVRAIDRGQFLLRRP
jgi:tellurite resistance protein